MATLWEPLEVRGLTLDHRVVVSPMVMYQATADGLATPWYVGHYGSFAVGGAAMVIVEATAVEARGRGTHGDLGLWSEKHVAPLRRVVEVIVAGGSVPGIQLNHAGRKGSYRRPWDGHCSLTAEDLALRGEAPWSVVGPSPLAVTPASPVPTPLNTHDIATVTESWASAARRADAAGFEFLEIHAAHGYLLHQFLSPVSNHRTDAYGGERLARMRFPLEVVEAVRAAWPARKPLSVRISAVDGVEGGWQLEDSVAFARELRARGVDLVDCSSGGIGGTAMVSRIQRTAGFQVGFAEHVRREAGIATIAVGLILTPEQAAEVVARRQADLVAIGREALVNPNWPHAARSRLMPGSAYSHWPPQVGWWLDKRDESVQAPASGG